MLFLNFFLIPLTDCTQKANCSDFSLKFLFRRLNFFNVTRYCSNYQVLPRTCFPTELFPTRLFLSMQFQFMKNQACNNILFYSLTVRNPSWRSKEWLLQLNSILFAILNNKVFKVLLAEVLLKNVSKWPSSTDPFRSSTRKLKLWKCFIWSTWWNNSWPIVSSTFKVFLQL